MSARTLRRITRSRYEKSRKAMEEIPTHEETIRRWDEAIQDVNEDDRYKVVAIEFTVDGNPKFEFRATGRCVDIETDPRIGIFTDDGSQCNTEIDEGRLLDGMRASDAKTGQDHVGEDADDHSPA